MNAEIENSIIDELVAKGYSEDKILDVLAENELKQEALDNIYFAAGNTDKKAARKAKKEQRKAARAEKKQAKKTAKAEKKSTKSGNGLETAERIGGLVSNLGNTVVNVSGALTNLRNSGNATPANERVEYNPDAYEEEDSTNWPLILGIGGAILAVVVIIIIIKKKK